METLCVQKFVTSLPTCFDASNVINILRELENSKVCPGNEDFQDLLENKVNGIDYFTPAARLEDQKLHPLEISINTTIRTFKCSTLLALTDVPLVHTTEKVFSILTESYQL